MISKKVERKPVGKTVVVMSYPRITTKALRKEADLGGEI